MIKQKHLFILLLFLLCSNTVLAQSISALPKVQSIACTGTADIDVYSGGQPYYAAVSGGLVILDNGQEKTSLITSQSRITVKSQYGLGSGRLEVSLVNNSMVSDYAEVNIRGPLLGAITGPTCVATRGTATYSIASLPDVTYLWTIRGNSARIVSAANASTVTVESTGTGSFLLNVTAIDACTSDFCEARMSSIQVRQTFSVTEDDLTGPTCVPFFAPDEDPIVEFKVNPYLGSMSFSDYLWSISPGLETLYRSADGSAITVRILDPYIDNTIRVTVGASCNPSNILTKVIKAKPTVPVMSQTDYCIPASQNMATFSIDPAYHKPDYNYQWTYPPDWIVVAQTETSTTVRMDASPGDVYVVAYNNGCQSDVKTFYVNRSSPDFCVSRSVLFSSFSSFSVSGLSGNTTDYTYRWYSGSTDLFSGSQYNQVVIDVTGKPTVYVDIASLTAPGCVTTLTMPSGGSGTTCTGNSTARSTEAPTERGSARAASFEEAPSVSLYPNPASREINIVISDKLRGATGQVYAANGTRMETLSLINNVTIDVSRYPDGIYFILIHGTGGMTYEKFIVKR